jgi:DNA repair exonuclease SbcCD ATPase subunit
MASLEEVHTRIQQKKKERTEIARMFKDDLANNSRYEEIIQEMKTLREEKKSIENQAYASAAKDAEKLDLLKLDIKSDQEQLADIAMTMYTEGKTVQVIDEYNNRWVPNFSVKFMKDSENMEAHAPAIEMASAPLEPAMAGGDVSGVPKFNANDR